MYLQANIHFHLQTIKEVLESSSKSFVPQLYKGALLNKILKISSVISAHLIITQ